MQASVDDRVAFPEGQVTALTQLLLSHIVALERQTPGGAANTLEYLEDQARAALDSADCAGLIMHDLADAVRDCLGLPVND